jgi:hypothetical protein
MRPAVSRSRLPSVALAGAALLAAASPAAAAEGGAEAPASPKLAVSVSLLRDTLRAGEALPLEVWVANSSAIAVAEVELHLQAPDFLRLAAGSCADSASGDLSLGPLAAGQTLGRRLLLCAGATIAEEDFNLLFVARYRWSEGDRERTSFAAVEKKVRLGLLGTESVGGFSLRLVAFVLPGLLFWMILRLFQVPYTTGFTTAESGALAVLTSALLIAAVSAWAPDGGGAGVSFRRLGLLCLLAIGPAVVIGLGAVVWRRGTERRRRALIVHPTDGVKEQLAKLLEKARPPVGRNATVKTKEGEYLGSMVAESGAGDYVLLGWYRLQAAPGAGGGGSPPAEREAKRLAQALAAAESRRDYATMLRVGERLGRLPELASAIRRRGDDGSWKPTADGVRFFAGDEVTAAGVTQEGPQAADGAPLPALS